MQNGLKKDVSFPRSVTLDQLSPNFLVKYQKSIPLNCSEVNLIAFPFETRINGGKGWLRLQKSIQRYIQ
jgi:hypothetical protein